MRALRNRLLIAVLLLTGVPALAADFSPVGTWKTIDDKTGKAKGIVQITEHNGVLEGRIIKVLTTKHGPHPVCVKCKGARHNQPVVGMTFLWGLTRHGHDWRGGRILDPNSGRVYKAKIRVIDAGRKLEVRGYIGFALLGRTQIWHRDTMTAPAAMPEEAQADAPDK